MKKGIYEYDPVIYPRLLWVAVGQDKKYIESMFNDNDGNELKIESDSKDYDGLTISEIERKDTGKYGELVIFDSRKSMSMSICAHEASHVCDFMEGVMGMKHGGEASAYLIGRIASCINKALIGIGNFIEKSKSEERA